jgi:hypothetical protein
MTDSYFVDGARRAAELGNRGPIAFDADGALTAAITDAYWRTGFYVFQGLIGAAELNELLADFNHLLGRAPTSSTSATDAHGRPALGLDLERGRFHFHFAKPLSDPLGGTDASRGRYQVKMTEHQAPDDAPGEVLMLIAGTLQYMDSFLRLYGHPHLLAVAERIDGPDFVPFTESIWVKQPGLGPATAWHQDGTTHWDSPELDAGTHGFNLMTQLYPTTAANALWVVPGTHRSRFDIAAQVAANGGSDRLPGAVPMLCNPGDVAINNRQVVHGAFANQSEGLRVTLVFGFHRRCSLLGVVRGDPPVTYDAARIHQRSRIIALAIDARRQRFPHERSYLYQPLANELDDHRWNEATREQVLKNYDTNTMFI